MPLIQELGKDRFAWSPEAFGGKGYWYLIDAENTIVRPAKKDEFKKLGTPKIIYEKDEKDEESNFSRYKDAFSKMFAHEGKSLGHAMYGVYSGIKSLVGKKKKKKDYANVSASTNNPVAVGDAVPDIGVKMFNLMRKTHEEDKIEKEIENDFYDTVEKKKNKKNEEIIDALLGNKSSKSGKAKQKKKKKSNLLLTIATVIGGFALAAEAGAAETKNETKPGELPPPSPIPNKPSSSVPPRMEEPSIPTVPAKKAEKVPVQSKKSQATPAPATQSTPSAQSTTSDATVLAQAATLSRERETGESGVSIKNVGQVKSNDPDPPHKSYGVFGINSRNPKDSNGKKLPSSLDSFIQENPQFKFTAKPETEEFTKQWKEFARTRTREFYDAQLNWYDRHIYTPVKFMLKKSVPEAIANSPSVIAYMADRKTQYGSVGEATAIEHAIVGTKTPKEFIEKMSAWDKAHIQTNFKTYLQTHPHDTKGLENRILERQKGALKLLNERSVGDTIDRKSIENMDMEGVNVGSATNILNNNTNVMMMVPQATNVMIASSDDSSSFVNRLRA